MPSLVCASAKAGEEIPVVYGISINLPPIFFNAFRALFLKFNSGPLVQSSPVSYTHLRAHET